MAYSNLGAVLQARKDLSGAEAADREAIRLDPNLALAHNNLGIVLVDRKDLSGAEAAFREAIRLDPEVRPGALQPGEPAAGHEGPGGCRRRVQESHPARPQAGYRGPEPAQGRADAPGPTPAARRPGRPGRARDAGRGVRFARLCGQPFKKRYAAAVRLFDGDVTADPPLAADLKLAHRYYASTYAVLAAAGEGIDAPADASARAALRQKALGWFGADLELRRKQAASADAAERNDAAAKLSYWLSDPDLSGVRDAGGAGGAAGRGAVGVGGALGGREGDAGRGAEAAAVEMIRKPCRTRRRTSRLTPAARRRSPASAPR